MPFGDDDDDDDGNALGLTVMEIFEGMGGVLGTKKAKGEGRILNYAPNCLGSDLWFVWFSSDAAGNEGGIESSCLVRDKKQN